MTSRKPWMRYGGAAGLVGGGLIAGALLAGTSAASASEEPASGAPASSVEAAERAAYPDGSIERSETASADADATEVPGTD